MSTRSRFNINQHSCLRLNFFADKNICFYFKNSIFHSFHIFEKSSYTTVRTESGSVKTVWSRTDSDTQPLYHAETNIQRLQRTRKFCLTLPSSFQMLYTITIEYDCIRVYCTSYLYCLDFSVKLPESQCSLRPSATRILHFFAYTFVWKV